MCSAPFVRIIFRVTQGLNDHIRTHLWLALYCNIRDCFFVALSTKRCGIMGINAPEAPKKGKLVVKKKEKGK